jgi:hypothetical protein
MRNIFSRSRRVAAAWLLIVVLLAPTAFASDNAGDASLWAEFIVWLQIGLDVPDDITADDVGFTIWLMGRIGIPNG